METSIYVVTFEDDSGYGTIKAFTDKSKASQYLKKQMLNMYIEEYGEGHDHPGMRATKKAFMGWCKDCRGAFSAKVFKVKVEK